MTVVFNLFEFARTAQSAKGELELTRMMRLDSPKREGALHWQMTGFVSRQKKLHLDLEIAGAIHLVCQRCLEPVKLKLAIQRRFLITRNEQEADAVPLDDDGIEVVVGSESFDVEALVEEEVLLSLPIVPMHQDCSQPLLNKGADESQNVADENGKEEAKIFPFAALEKLKSK